ncbi:alpha/beta hydrolase [Camelimonas abortus]|uniref:Alpha/beta hydrolase n=1 Tax=Camelimonas abortus TaxID=1017184 RepID=A0ABV7LHJ3_9HYPH
MNSRTFVTRRRALALAGAALAAGGGRAAHAGPPADAFVYAVTTRRPVNGAGSSPWFGPERSGGTRVVRALMRDNDRSLVGKAVAAVAGRWSLTGVEGLGPGDPVAALTAAVGGSNVLVYVHGYKTSFATSVVDAITLARGIGFDGVPVAFSWPSRDAILDYGYDRESAMWSRDAFQDILESLGRNPAGGVVNIVAHSMGCLLTMETLRQLWALSGSMDLAARIGAIVLAAPDIDVDLFATSLKRIGPLAAHITVIGSTRDTALALSEAVAGGVARVGAAARAQLEPLGVKVVDASGYGWGVIGHDTFLTNADVRAVVRRAIERGAHAQD